MRGALEQLRRGLHPTQELFVGTPAPFLLRPLNILDVADDGDEDDDDDL